MRKLVLMFFLILNLSIWASWPDSLAFTKGFQRDYKVRMIVVTKSMKGANSAQSKRKGTLPVNLKIDKILSPSQAKVRLKIGEVLCNWTENGQSYQFDSSKDRVNSTSAQILYPLLARRSFSFNLTDRGKISNIEGLEKVRKDFFSVMWSANTKKKSNRLSKSEVRILVDKMLAKIDFEKMLPLRAIPVPKKKVSPGKTWKTSRQKKFAFPVVVKSVNTLKSDDGKTLSISSAEKINAQPHTSTSSAGIVTAANIEGKGRSEMKLDTASGWPTYVRSMMKVKLDTIQHLDGKNIVLNRSQTEMTGIVVLEEK